MRYLPSRILRLDFFCFDQVKFQLVGADLGEIRRDHCRRHVFNSRRRPFWIAVLVDHGGAHALAEIVAGEDFQRGAIFPHQAFLQRARGARQPQQFQRHHHAARRLFVQRLQRRLRKFRAIALQRRDDVFHAIVGEQRVDLRLHRRDRPGRLAGRKAVDQLPDVGRRRAGRDLRQRLAQGRQFADGTTASANLAWIASGPFMVCPVNPK